MSVKAGRAGCRRRERGCALSRWNEIKVEGKSRSERVRPTQLGKTASGRWAHSHHLSHVSASSLLNQLILLHGQYNPITLEVAINTLTAGGVSLSIEPNDVTVDSQGNIYAVDLITDTIIKLSSNGTQLQVFYNPRGELDGNPQWQPLTVAVDSAGNVFAGNQDGDNVFPQKGSITKFAANGTVMLQFVAKDVASFIPYGVRVDSAGDIWVVLWATGGIVSFEGGTVPAGDHMSELAHPGFSSGGKASHVLLTCSGAHLQCTACHPCQADVVGVVTDCVAAVVQGDTQSSSRHVQRCTHSLEYQQLLYPYLDAPTC